jgi:hypothetical protein
MPIKPLNSVAGFSVGETPSNVVDANLNFTGNTANFTGNLISANANLGNLARANFFQGDGSLLTNIPIGTTLSNGTSNVSIPVINGNVNTSVGGNANIVVVTGTGVNVAGTFNVTGDANAGNIGATRGVFTNIAGEGGNISNIQGANVSGAVASATSATNAAALLTNTSSATTVYPTFTTLSANGNSSAVFNTGISANLGNNSITATTFVGNVSGNISGNITGILANGNSNVNIPAANGNVNISAVGNANILVVTGTGVNVAGTFNATGNANVGNLGVTEVVATTLGGTLTTAAQPNITSVGTLSSLAVTGNVSAGNLTTTGALSVTGTGVSSIAGNLDMTSNTIINLATPTNPNDAATKQYVDDIAQGLHTHDSCNAATTTTLASISGGTVTYDNGTSGVGATLTTTGTYTTIDGVTLSNGMRILVKNEANAAHNGIYARTSTTVLTRSTDFDTPAEMAGGDFTFVTAGTLYDNTGWVMTDPVTTVGTTNVNWVQFSGAGAYTAGTGLTLTGTQFSITSTSVSAATYGNGDRVASFTVNAQGQLTNAANTVITANAANLTGTTLNSSIVTSSLTSVGTLSSLAVTGNTTSGNFVGIFANGNSNVNIPAANGNVNISAAGNANILVITGTGANIAGTLNVTGISNLGPNGNVIITGGSSGQYLQTNGSGALSWASVPTGTGISNGTSNVSIPAVNGNVNTSVAGNANILVVTGTGVNVAGTLNATGNANLNNLGTAQVLATANVTAPQLISNVTTGTAPLTVTSTTRVANLNVAYSNVADLLSLTSVSTGTFSLTFANTTTGNAQQSTNAAATFDAATGALSATLFTGTLTTAAQPNITSVGTLTSLAVTGNVTAGNLYANSGTAGANIVSANNRVVVGNSAVRWAQATTTAITANQAISTLSVTGITGVEWLVRGVDSGGGKHSVATVIAVTNGSTVDYSIFGTVNIGTTTGTLAVNLNSGNIELQVTPSSTSSTVWVTQYRTI